MGCQTQKVDIVGSWSTSAAGRPRLTPKGERTRARIVEAAAGLIHERGVAGTTLDDVRAAAEVSGSQYVPLLRRQGRARAGGDRPSGGRHRRRHRAGGPGQRRRAPGLAGHDHRAGAGAPRPRAAARSGRSAARWPRATRRPAPASPPDSSAGRRSSATDCANCRTPATSRPASTRDDLALTVLAALQGGLLLAQVQRDAGPLETVVDTVLALAAGDLDREQN